MYLRFFVISIYSNFILLNSILFNSIFLMTSLRKIYGTTTCIYQFFVVQKYLDIKMRGVPGGKTCGFSTQF